MTDITAPSLAFIVLLVMVTLGSCTLVHIIAPRAGHLSKCLTSAVLGPLATLLPIILIADITGEPWMKVVAFFGLLLALTLLVGWPLSHLVHRRLTRHFRFGPEEYE